ncbi:hypothetical protein L484_017143 [Morus notabilis]|uniref:Succinate dehydrogenase subunit 6 n=1 Tax=Morus notabilis TaxID=981085 RepID=W9QTG2_9ROSA|nr:succinate dehydrogenase subunit 6, mitochondrial [Morus notabilis]EXB39668.1 hypothetical protein L484_017143 [Morus notabilis]
MADGSSSQSSFKSTRECFKDFLADRYSFLDNYSRFLNRNEPLPSWSSSDVEEFIASDPVHGPTLKAAKETSKYGLAGSVIGAVSTAGVTWKYSRSLHGTALSFIGGGIFGYTIGAEIANHAFQLYKLDTVAAQVKFFEWWENKRKSEGQS